MRPKVNAAASPAGPAPTTTAWSSIARSYARHPRPTRASAGSTGASLLLARPKRPAHTNLELEVAVETHAVDRLAHGLHHRRRDVEVVDLEDQVPGPGVPVRADLQDVVAE